MIKLTSIAITEFRGIRQLTLAPEGVSFAVCGPNGTGKSGVVDAIEFALTGDISRLSGEGRGDISIKEHGAHVDSRNNPEKSRVTAVLTIPSLGKTVTIERGVKDPRHPTITPADPDVLEVLKQVQTHPEFALTRREIIKYVLATPGERAEEVQALLHLDHIETVRANLKRIANATDKEMKAAALQAQQARDNLLRALGLGTLTKDEVLRVTNEKRGLLGLSHLTDLTEATSLKDGLVSASGVSRQRVGKAHALDDIRAARIALEELGSAPTVEVVTKAQELITRLAGNPLLATAIQREKFYVAGLALVDSDHCPFCGKDWDLADLREHVRLKRQELDAARADQVVAEKALEPLVAVLAAARGTIETVQIYGSKLTPQVPVEAMQAFLATCRTSAAALTELLPLDKTTAALSSLTIVPPTVRETLDAIEAAVAALPDPSSQDAARDWLSIAQERLEVYRESMRNQAGARARAQRAQVVAATYSSTSDSVLTGIYTTVQEDFAALYQAINSSDEGGFKAQLTPSMGKLGFDVEFYGRGFFPPGAYHSEGHQDGMGLCLYLALMRFLQGPHFTFAVLDDVLMSVDAGHRREICRLLKKECPNTQFIVTTHDRVWLQHMKAEQLIGSSSAVHFRSWNVSDGPSQWEDRDVWAEIEQDLKDNEVQDASVLMRGFLEFTASELCHRLRGKVELRGDGQYELGDLMPAAIGQLTKLLADGKKAANSWNHKEVVEALVARATGFSDAVKASQVDQWQMNAAIHYNAWANLAREEFRVVVAAFRALLGQFACSDCHGFLRVIPERGKKDALKCECGKVSINLSEKEA